MKTIIAGSRTINDLELLSNMIIRSGIEITEVVCGLAKGIDRLGETWARLHNIPIAYFRPQWALYGLSAGPKRNKQMADYAEAALIIWDGFSRGTKNMVDLAKKKGLHVFVYNQSKDSVDIWPTAI